MINKFIAFISSMKFALLLIIIFAFSIGYATFIENDYGTATAKALIYNVWWFDLLLILLCVSLFFNMLRFNIFRRDKLATLTFHLSFILILIGSGITRFTGEEGMIVIDEGDSSSTFYTNDPYFQLSVTDSILRRKSLRENLDRSYTHDMPLNLAGEFKDSPLFLLKYLRSNYFKISSDKGFLPNGFSIAPLRLTRNNHHEFKQRFTIEYVDFITDANSDQTNNMRSQSDKIKDGMISALVVRTSSLGNIQIDTLVREDINSILDGLDYASRFKIGDLEFDLSYGSKKKVLPFDIYLKDFQLDKYPGSELPASFASEVQVRDNSIKKDYRIYMNNTLNYKGYRFFQSNYGTNAKGVEYTVLSVNSDFWGTRVTYLGYLIMAIGMILVFFQNRTRFRVLSDKLKKLRKKSLILLFVLSPLFSFPQENSVDTEVSKFNVNESRDAINKLGLLLSGDTIINGKLFYDILLKGREDIQYLINTPVINISDVRGYFPGLDKNLISYITYNDYFNGSVNLQAIQSGLIDDLKNGRPVNYSDTAIFKLFYSCDQFFEIVNIIISNEVQKIKSLTSLNETAGITQEEAINFVKGHKFDKEVINEFQRLLVQDNGRIKPIHTMALEYIRKVTKSGKGMYGKRPIDMFLGMITYPDFWSRVPLIKIEHEKVKLLFDIDNDHVSYMVFLNKLRSENQLSPCNLIINIKSKSSESVNSGTNVSLDEMEDMQLLIKDSIVFKGVDMTFNAPKQHALNFYCENGDLTFSYFDTLEFMSMPPDSRGARKVLDQNIVSIAKDSQYLITINSNKYFVSFTEKVRDDNDCFSCQYDLASRKEEKNRSKFDKEILKVGERYTILIKTFNYSAFRLLPIINDENDTWAVNAQKRLVSNQEFIGFTMTSRSETSLNEGQGVSLDDMITKSINLRESITFKSIPITLDSPKEGALNFFYSDNKLSCIAFDTIKIMSMPPDGTGYRQERYFDVSSSMILNIGDSIKIVISDFLYNNDKGSQLEYTYLHPSSYVYNNKVPAIRYYSYLIRGNKIYMANQELSMIRKYQKEYGGDIIPSDFKVSLEILNNKLNIFFWLFIFNMMMGISLLTLLIIERFKQSKILNMFIRISKWLIVSSFVIHSIMLIVRWIISEHAPWTNGYEAMIYVAWATILAGIVFSRKSLFALPATAFVSGVILLVAYMNDMDPQITTLVPVLDSYWLMIHVELIVASYAFFFLAAFLGLLSLILMAFMTKNNKEKFKLMIEEFSLINEQTINIGLFMLTIGTFLGGVWASESWGRYWGWDPKETWALVSILVYAFILHMRFIPGLKSKFIFNLMSLVSIYSIIMTFWGVNHLLSGLHSYAAGDAVPIPNYIWISIFSIFLIAFFAKRKYNKYSI